MYGKLHSEYSPETPDYVVLHVYASAAAAAAAAPQTTPAVVVPEGVAVDTTRFWDACMVQRPELETDLDLEAGKPCFLAMNRYMYEVGVKEKYDE